MSQSLIACHECDLLLQKSEMARQSGIVKCPRCGAELYSVGPKNLQPMLALTIAALTLLALANLFPIVALNIQGHQVETTAFGAAQQLWRDEMPIVACLLFATTVVIPFLELTALCWILLPLSVGRRPIAFIPLFRSLQLTHPWTMVEVFILGVLVSLVKLSHLADVLPGPAIWCFGALAIVLTGLSAVLDHHALWEAWGKVKS